MNNFQLRSEQLFEEQRQQIFKRTDRLFAALLVFEWICLIGVAAIVSPQTWVGSSSFIHPHIWTAVFIGGMVIAFPVCLVKLRPGCQITRHSIAIGQMLMAALLIHLTGGRIESHFHIFGSLAFLAFYRDWRVLVTASIVTALDHFLRGVFYPQSIYGLINASPWRTVEHVFWVVFEDIFLIRSCWQGNGEMLAIAARRAEIEESKENVELLVKERTHELQLSEQQLTAQYEVSRILAEASSFSSCAQSLLASISKSLFADMQIVFSAVWVYDQSVQSLRCSNYWNLFNSTQAFQKASEQCLPESTDDLPRRVWTAGSIQWITDLTVAKELARSDSAIQCGLKTGIAFPIVINGSINAVIELYTNEIKEPSSDIFDLLVALGRQIGQFIANKKSQEINEQLVTIVESSTDAIYGMTLDLTITSWNRGAERMYGYTVNEAVGKNIKMIVPDDKLDEWMKILEKVKHGPCVEGLDSTRKRMTGDFDVSVSLAPIYRNGEIVGISEIDRDISERKSAEKRVSEFYSIVSHELRTPLTSIRGALGLIEAGVVKPTSEKCMELIKIGRVSSDRLIRLINDILDLKKIEVGKFELHLEPVPADKLLHDAVNSLMGMANERGVKLTMEKATPNVTIEVDADRCTQVLANLISNALKFSPDGSEVLVNGVLTDPEQIRFNVQDNGPGILSSDLPNLFQKFKQLDSSDTRRSEGTGLGLAVSKALAEQLGGQIGVQSQPGLGSTFWFELPLYQNSKIK